MSLPFAQLSFPEMFEQVLVGPLFRPWVDPTLDAVRLAPGDRVLDVACGTGIVARVARERLGEQAIIAGVDVSALTVSLNDVLRGERTVDTERGIRIYKSTGSGLQDIVVAETLVDLARERGIGTQLPVSIVTTRK